VRSFGANGRDPFGQAHLSAYDRSDRKGSAAVFELGVPVLGICYGMQTMAQQLGGKVEPGKVREFGHRRSARARAYALPRRDRRTIAPPKDTAC
jgi:GMP synthase (glutamine-hydrolysing)